MTMLNFDCEVDTPSAAPAPVMQDFSAITDVTVASEVTVTRQPSEASGYLSRDGQSWDWRDLRDYVVHEIEQKFGTWPRDQKKEYGIFSRFVSTWGDQAAAIAQYAFEVSGGWWMNAPISINRFCKGSDPIFAKVILERLLASQPASQ